MAAYPFPESHTEQSATGVVDQARQHPSEEVPASAASAMPPAAAAATLLDLRCSFTSGGQQHIGAALPMHPLVYAYGSESGTAALGPSEALRYCIGTPTAGPVHAACRSAPPVGPGLSPAAVGVESRLGAAPLPCFRARVSEPQDPDIRELLLPCDNPCLPLEAGWAQCAAMGPACGTGAGARGSLHEDNTLGLGGIASLPSSLSSDLGDGPWSLAVAAAAALAAVSEGQPDGVGLAPAIKKPPASSHHRACEFGYTCSAPAHHTTAAVSVAAQGALQDLQGLLGALSAPTMHNDARRDGSVSRAVPQAAAATAAAAPLWALPASPPARTLQAARPSDMTPEAQRRGGGRDTSSGCTSAPVSGAPSSGGPSARVATTAARGVTGRRKSSAAHMARHAMLGTAAVATSVAAGWLPASASEPSQQGGLWAPSSGVSYGCDRRSVGARSAGSAAYFGGALALGLSTLLDTIAADAAVASKSPTREPTGLGLLGGTQLGRGLGSEPGSGWVRARGCARVLGHRIFGCFTGASACSSSPSSSCRE